MLPNAEKTNQSIYLSIYASYVCHIWLLWEDWFSGSLTTCVCLKLMYSRGIFLFLPTFLKCVRCDAAYSAWRINVFKSIYALKCTSLPHKQTINGIYKTISNGRGGTAWSVSKCKENNCSYWFDIKLTYFNTKCSSCIAF